MSPLDQHRIDHPEWFRTFDGAEITDGLRVWDHDLSLGTVDFTATRADGSMTGMDGEYWRGWYVVALDTGGTSSMNGERLRVRHHFSGQPAPAGSPF